MITPRPMDTAPKDGTKIYANDGEWWRRARWYADVGSLGPPGWYGHSLASLEPIEWHPKTSEGASYDDFDELIRAVAYGESPCDGWPDWMPPLQREKA